MQENDDICDFALLSRATYGLTIAITFNMHHMRGNMDPMDCEELFLRVSFPVAVDGLWNAALAYDRGLTLLFGSIEKPFTAISMVRLY